MTTMKPTLLIGDMRYWRMQPDARLRPWIHCYFLVEPGPEENRRTSYLSEALELLIPDGHSEIIFNFGGAYERWHVNDSGRASVMHSSYVIGGRSQSVLTRNVEKVRLAGVKLDPRALQALLSVPLDKFADSTLTLADLNDRSLLELEDSLAAANSAAIVKNKLDLYFLRVLGKPSSTHNAVVHLMHDIHRTRGALPIMQWARTHKLDSRTLERNFSASLGMTPKRYARVIRFKHSYHHLISARHVGAAGAHLDGFYDQSHFNREFRYFTGTAPNAKLTGKMSSGTSISDHLLEGELRR